MQKNRSLKATRPTSYFLQSQDCKFCTNLDIPESFVLLSWWGKLQDYTRIQLRFHAHLYFLEHHCTAFRRCKCSLASCPIIHPTSIAGDSQHHRTRFIEPVPTEKAQHLKTWFLLFQFHFSGHRLQKVWRSSIANTSTCCQADIYI